MTYDEAMTSLEKAGTAQNRKIYANHGVKGEQFGVSSAHCAKMLKQVKRDHELAKKLWKSGNYDARSFATMIADPQQLDDKLLDAWVKDVDNYPLAGAVARMVAASPLAEKKMNQWKDSPDEYAGEAGWYLVAMLAGPKTPHKLPDAYFDKTLQVVEKEVHGAKNRVKHGMMGALIAIGGYRTNLTDKVIASAKRIGKVEIDHGATACKTPDPIPYIQKMLARNKAQAK
jgi:3-methyladenine DNA glycosylase AlkD